MALKIVIVISALLCVSYANPVTNPITLTYKQNEDGTKVYRWNNGNKIALQYHQQGSNIDDFFVEFLDKSMEVNPEEQKVYLISDDLKGFSNEQNPDMAELLLMSKNMSMLHNYSHYFDNFAMNINGSVLTFENSENEKVRQKWRMEMREDNSFITSFNFYTSNGPLSEIKIVQKIQQSRFAIKNLKKIDGSEFKMRIITENPELSVDFYMNESGNVKININIKDFLIDFAKLENTFPINLLKEFKETGILKAKTIAFLPKLK